MGRDPELRDRVAAVLKEISRGEDVWLPVHLADLDDDDAARYASIAVRRWRSFERRARGPRPDRVHDLARGLRAAMIDRASMFEEPSPLEDFVELAERLAPVLERGEE